MVRRSLLILLLVAAAAAQAQEPAGPPAEGAAPEPYPQTVPVATQEPQEQPKPEKGPATQLEEVVVTSTKRAKSVREIPASVNALQGEALEKMGAHDIRDYLNMVPGIALTESSSGDQDLNSTAKISIRGIAPSDTANQTTGLLFGDVSLTDPYGSYAIPDVEPFDLSTVEVLKGPQGTLFGASALNGAIRYVPNRPELGQWGGKLFADGRSMQHSGSGGSTGGALNVPIGDSLAFRGMGLVQYLPGLYDSISPSYTQPRADSSHKWDARGMVRWEPIDRFSANGLYMIQRRRGNGITIADNGDGEFKNSAQSPSDLASNFDVGNIDLRYAFDWATLVSQTSRSTKMRETDVDSSSLVSPPLPPGQAILRTYVKANILTYSEELRLVSPDTGRWVWLAGLYYDWYRMKASLNQDYAPDSQSGATLLTLLPLLGPTVSSDRGVSAAYGYLGPEPLHATERAAFGELTYKLFDHWQLTAGGRAYKTRLESDLTLSGLLIPAIYPGTTTYQHHYDLQAGGFSPKFAVTYQPSKKLMAYANASRGFQFGGVNVYQSVDPRYSTPGLYKSSKIWNYEIGERSDWLNRTLRTDLTLFWIDWTEPQVMQHAPGANIYLYVDNVGAARSRGAETSLRWLTPIPGVSIGSAASYIVAKTTVPYTNAEGDTVAPGTDMPLSPRWQVATTLGYTGRVGGWVIGPTLVHTYQGSAWNDIEHDHKIYGYGMFNASLDFSRPDWRFAPEVNIGVTNLTNVRAYNAYHQGALLSGSNCPVANAAVCGIYAPIGGSITEQSEHTSANYTRPRAITLHLSASF